MSKEDLKATPEADHVLSLSQKPTEDTNGCTDAVVPPSDQVDAQVFQDQSIAMDSTANSSQAGDDTDGDIAGISRSHARFESIAPQKYDLDDIDTKDLSKILSHQLTIDEEIDISHGGYDMSLASSSYGLSRPSSRSQQLDRADLNFVDIALADSESLDPHHPLSGSMKSAEQIKGDSFSSQAPPKSPTYETDHIRAYLTRSESHQSNASDSLRVEDSDTSRPESWVGSAQGGADGRRVSTGSASGDRKAVEGRYRGRVSRSSSRAASPGRDPGSASRRASTSHEATVDSPVEQSSGSAPPHTPSFLRPAPVLVAGDDEGNISIAHDVPISPRTIAAPESRSPRHSTHSDISHDASKGGNVAARSSAEIANHAARTSSVVDAETAQGKDAGLSDKADEGDRKSSIASATVESRTRMTTLPAKTKAEEIKHRGDFEKMMMFAKEQEKKRQEDESERRRRKQDEQREALGRWERDILPSWTRARKDETLAELWWKGAPPSIRGRVWALAIGNPLMLPRNLLDQTLKRANTNGDSLETVIPPNVLDEIDEDVQDTLPSLKLFQESGPLHSDLLLICKAFVLVRMEQVSGLDSAGDADRAAAKVQSTSPRPKSTPLPDTATNSVDTYAGPEDVYAQRGIQIYQRGLAILAAILLINLPASTAFICLLNLINSKAWLKAIYSLLPVQLPDNSSTTILPFKATHRGSAYNLAPKEKAIRGFERVLETLLADKMPKVYANMLARNVKLYRVVLRDWVGQLFGKHLDIDTVMRLWDVILLDETDSMIYRTCLAVVQTLESRLYVPDQEELESVLAGTNRAALHIWRRDKEPTGELMLHVPTSPRRPSRASFSSHTTVKSPTTISAELNKQCSPPPPLHNASDPHLNHFGMSESDILPRDYIYEQYGIKEDTIFDTLDEQEHSWKQSTLNRLLERELAD